MIIKLDFGSVELSGSGRTQSSSEPERPPGQAPENVIAMPPGAFSSPLAAARPKLNAGGAVPPSAETVQALRSGLRARLGTWLQDHWPMNLQEDGKEAGEKDRLVDSARRTRPSSFFPEAA